MGHISPQYHVVFDEKFTTVIGAGDEPSSLTEWMEIFTDGQWLHESIEQPQDDHGTAWVLPPDVDQSFVIPRREVVTKETGVQAEPLTTEQDIQKDNIDITEAVTQVNLDMIDHEVAHQESAQGVSQTRRLLVPPGRFPANTTAEVSSESAQQQLGFVGKPSLSKQAKFNYGTTLPRVHGKQLNQQQLLATLCWYNLVQ
jgi:hypothetical protein